MMLRNLIDEVRSRRVLAFAALGVLVALAVPLLFLKSAPEGAPSANTAAPAPAAEAKLPERAARLLAATDAASTGGHADGSSADPFSPPAAYRAAIAAAEAKGDAGAAAPKGSTPKSADTAGTSKNPVKVEVTNPGATPQAPSAANNTATTRPSSAKRARTLTARNAAVDVRFGPKADTRIRRAIPRQKAFYIHGRLVAVFVKYSPSRRAAVFALAPGLHVAGDVSCRIQGGSCRYVAIPEGAHARLTTLTANRTLVSRRLDVVHIKRRSAGASTRATAARGADVRACLLRKLLAMDAGDAPVDRDACKS